MAPEHHKAAHGDARGRGVHVAPPILACGDTGVGAMAEVADIHEQALGLCAHAAAEAEAAAQAFVP